MGAKTLARPKRPKQGKGAYDIYRTAINAAFTGFMWLFLLFVLFITAYPLWYVFIYSISDPTAFSPTFQFLPNGISLEAYLRVFTNDGFLNAFFISVARSTIGPIVSGVVTMMIAYGVSTRDLPGRRFFNWYFLFTMYFSAGLIPTFLLYQSLGLVNSFWVYIVPSIVNVFGMILMRTYIESLPAEMKESAYIDGANDFTIFYKIITPLCIPVIAAVTLFAAVHQWNAYFDTVIYNATEPRLHPLQYFLVQMVAGIAGGSGDAAAQMAAAAAAQGATARVSPTVVRMAVTVVTIVPISLLYPFIQRYFMKGLLVGSVKG
ncbi:MAG: carbohydrate ABC transporter permease [Defluviitaleaceae bacterium]|nr:carbohydrate ABC transporter permease [Defluviitaleaceae bacterium]